MSDNYYIEEMQKYLDSGCEIVEYQGFDPGDSEIPFQDEVVIFMEPNGSRFEYIIPAYPVLLRLEARKFAEDNQ